jgi:hypothetical protein
LLTPMIEVVMSAILAAPADGSHPRNP